MGIINGLTDYLVKRETSANQPKKNLKKAFPETYKTNTKSRTAKKVNKPSAISDSVDTLSKSVKITNSVLVNIAEIQTQQNVILGELINAIHDMKSYQKGFFENLLDDMSMPNIPEKEKIKPKEVGEGKGKPKTVKTKPGFKYNEKTQRYHEVKPDGKMGKMVTEETATGVPKAGKPVGPPVESTGASKMAKFSRLGGAAMAGAGGALAGYEEYQQSGNLGKATAVGAGSAVGGWAGAESGAILGATIGAAGGPFAWLTIPLGGIIGGVAGGIGGSMAGESIARTGYDYIAGEDPKKPNDAKPTEVNKDGSKVYSGDILSFEGKEITFTANEMILRTTELLINGASSESFSNGGADLSSVATPTVNAGTDQGEQVNLDLVDITTSSGRKAKVNRAYAANFQGFINELEATGYKINSIGGYANRANVNNPSVKSYHALGAAIDINPGSNPNGSTRTDLPPQTAAIAAKYGLGWGMNWRSVKDPMHFSIAKSEQGSVNISRTGFMSGEVQGGAATGGNGAQQQPKTQAAPPVTASSQAPAQTPTTSATPPAAVPAPAPQAAPPAPAATPVASAPPPAPAATPVASAPPPAPVAPAPMPVNEPKTAPPPPPRRPSNIVTSTNGPSTQQSTVTPSARSNKQPAVSSDKDKVSEQSALMSLPSTVLLGHYLTAAA